MIRRSLLILSAMGLLCACGHNPDKGELACQRRILEAGVTNARDTGGLALADGRRLPCLRLLRGGALGGLDQAGCAEWAALGVRTILDLRAADVQAGAPPPSCATATATHVPAPMPKLLPDTAAHYIALLDEAEALRTVFVRLAAADALPVYVHCEIGRDRASVVTALVLTTLGVGRAAVLEEFKRSNEANVPVKEECLVALLDELDRRGGVDAYLESIGVGSETRAGVRAAFGGE